MFVLVLVELYCRGSSAITPVELLCHSCEMLLDLSDGDRTARTYRSSQNKSMFFQDFLTVGESKSARCDDLESLKKRGCSEVENPRGKIVINQDKPVTNRKDKTGTLKPEDITQIQPQKLTLTLRSGNDIQSTVISQLFYTN